MDKCHVCDHRVFVESIHDNEHFVMMRGNVIQAVKGLCAQYFPEDKEFISDAEVVVTEALDNAFKHTDGIITACVGVLSNQLCMAITDEGNGITYETVEKYLHLVELENEEIDMGEESIFTHGRGLFIISSLSDEITLQRTAEGFTCAITKKAHKGEQNGEERQGNITI